MQSTNQIPERKEINQKYKWNLNHLYNSKEAFEQEKELVTAKIKNFSRFSGTLNNKTSIKEALDEYYDLEFKVLKLFSFASKLFDQDTRANEAIGIKKIAEKLLSDFKEATAFMEPELLVLHEKKIMALLNEAAYKDYDMYLNNLLRSKPHVLTEKEETILAKSSIVMNSGYNTYYTLFNGELEFPQITLSDGSKIKLSPALFTKYRQNPVRLDRKAVFEAYFSTLSRFKNTFAQTLSSHLEAKIFYTKTKKFSSSAEAALFSENIPVKFYENLIQVINDNLPILHRYLKLKKKLLHIDEMQYYDLYPSIAGQITDTYTFEEGNRFIIEALEPLGDEYLQAIKKAVANASGWIDVYPNQGKRNGAYMSGGSYNPHPYILMNYNNDYDSISTQVHELGHAMHSYFSNITQIYAKSSYTSFAAEVASTFNENLLFEYMLKKEKNAKKKLALLGEFLETIRTTVFRQALFSEFEYYIYEIAEKKEPLTADLLNSIYLNHLKKYYGQDQKVVRIEDKYASEWAQVPHFYYNFYVYKYASGYLIGLTLSDLVLKGDPQIRDKYINNLLKSGGSKYPLEQIKEVGIDLLSEKPFQTAFKIIEKRISEVEKLT